MADAHIKRLTVEDFKRIVAVDIAADGHVVISGENDAGKSSIFDAIKAAFGGRREIPEDPIRHGAESSKIAMEIDGEMPLTVLLRIREKGSTITVTNRDGSKHPRAQEVLNTFYNAISFDPEAFEKASPSKRADMLCKAAGIDLTEADVEIARTYDIRTDSNRRVKVLEATVETLTVDGDVPNCLVDMAALAVKQKVLAEEESSRVAVVGEYNRTNLAHKESLASMPTAETAVEVAQKQREQDQLAFDEASESAKSHRTADAIKQAMDDLRTKKQALETQHQALVEEQFAAKDARQIAESAAYQNQLGTRNLAAAQETLTRRKGHSATFRRDLDEASLKVTAHRGEDEIADDAQDVLAEIEAATLGNAAYEAAASHRKIKADLDAAAKKAEAAEWAVKEAREVKGEILASIDIPVEGLELTMDGDVLIKGVPFDQDSESGRIETSIAIGMALNPKLKTMCVRQASLIGPAKFRRMCETAGKKGYNLWFERVGEDEHTTVVIEEGMIKPAKH